MASGKGGLEVALEGRPSPRPCRVPQRGQLDGPVGRPGDWGRDPQIPRWTGRLYRGSLHCTEGVNCLVQFNPALSSSLPATAARPWPLPQPHITTMPWSLHSCHVTSQTHQAFPTTGPCLVLPLLPEFLPLPVVASCLSSRSQLACHLLRLS